MPLNQLENFIKNTEGRILYVNPNDLDSTDSIVNQGNSLTKPFKTIQRALVESARFSYLRGRDNDLVEKTTILLFPGEHVIDNRPGFAIREEGAPSFAEAVAPNGSTSLSRDTFNLTLTSNFDLTQEDNVLYKFNSVEGGVIVPRGTSIVGLDLRKVKIRPKYVPNPTDPFAPRSSIFRITGACYFWQASFFDGDEIGVVYTDPKNFTPVNRSKPTFSHHKLTCFEYADGINLVDGYNLTDLEMYYAKLTNAFNESSGRQIPASDKFPINQAGFSPQRPEYEIVGAFASDPFEITSIQSGNGLTASNIVTVTTAIPHELSSGTPIKIRGVDTQDYNISTKVAEVDPEDPTKFTYLLPFVRNNLPAFPGTSVATVTIETDTVSGASPYIFNCSLRSVWGMSGLVADGKKASGFRSMVTAQFTAVSLQKDDRAFVKYDPVERTYKGLNVSTVVRGAELSAQSSSTDSDSVYHLDPRAVYRRGWETSHHKLTNDAFIQIVSVFAIGFNKHFDAESGGDASITNSNSNFGQFSLVATGYKSQSFAKDNFGYITSIITPKSNVIQEENIDWISLDIGLTQSAKNTKHLYIYGFKNADIKPPNILQQYRLGAKVGDKVFVDTPNGVKDANIFLVDNVLSTTGINTRSQGVQTSEKFYEVGSPIFDEQNRSTVFQIFSGVHQIQTGEKVRIFSDDGDLPENLRENVVYYAIRRSTTQIQLSSSLTNSQVGVSLVCHGGSKLSIVSRVSDKEPGDIGSPIQYDLVQQNWFVNTNSSNNIYTTIQSLGIAGFGTDRTEVSFIKRTPDSRSLDEKLYKIRVVVPKDALNARDPVVGYVLQESSTTGVTNPADFTRNTISILNPTFNRNPRFISTCSVDGVTITVTSELPHNLKANDIVIIKNVTSTQNLTADENFGYNGTFEVKNVINNHTFTYGTTDIFGKTRNVGNFTNNTNIRNEDLPRFEKNDTNSNYYIYRSEVISPYEYGVQDGIYHLYILNSSNKIIGEFDNLNYGQNIVDLYPQLDNDNVIDNPPSAKTFAKRFPIGQVVTNDLKKSITRENIDKFLKDYGPGLTITGVTTSFSSPVLGSATLTFNKEHEFSGIVTYSSFNSGSGYNNGTYYNVKLLNFGSSAWDGATAKVTVSSTQVNSVEIISRGSGYTNGEVLEFDTGVIGPGSGASIQITTNTISGDLNSGIQITGIGTASDGFYKISSIPASNQVSIAITNFDPRIVVGQYAIPTGPSATVSSSSYDSSTGILQLNFGSAHGLVVGNKFRLFNSSNQNLGDFLVEEKVSSTVITSYTNKNLSVTGGYITKHGLSSNNAISDISGENLGTRGLYFYDNEATTLSVAVSDDSSVIRIPVTQAQLPNRFPLGSFIQIDNEIMRVASKTLTGSGNNELQVIRGYLGTRTQSHLSGTLVKKIKPIPIEFRRPSILRASGHTFEYLGYGPGNYSTGLPQVQVTSLTEVEAFLSQSQQRSCGSVAYTGMNNDGDFFIGNTKYSSTSGEQITFGIPVPTVTGRDPSRLSVVFDEVVIKERLIVEGGNSGTILSQFDGPVTFNGEVRLNKPVTFNSSVRIKEDLRVDGSSRFGKIVTIDDTTDAFSLSSAALIVRGGVAISKDLIVGKNLRVTGISTFTGLLDANGGATIDNVRIGILNDNTIDTSTGNLTLDSAGGTVVVNDNLTLSGLLDGSGGAKIKNVRIGISGNNEIDTSTGNLIIDSAGGTVTIDDNLVITGGTTFAALIQADGAAISKNIRIGVTEDNTIDTVTGNLILDSLAGTVQINDNVTISGTLDANGLVTGFAGAKFKQVRIAVDNNNTVDTITGNLILDSFSGTVEVNDDLVVSGFAKIRNVRIANSSTNSTEIDTISGNLILDSAGGTVQVDDNLLVTGNGIIRDVRIGVSAANEIDTSSGNLILDSAGGTVQVTDNLLVTGNGIIRDVRIGVSAANEIDTSSGNLILDSAGGTVTVDDNLSVVGNATIRNVRIGVSAANEIDTSSGNLILDSTGGTVQVTDNLSVTENLTVTGATTLTGLLDANGGATIDNIQIGITNNNTIDTSTGTLFLGGNGVSVTTSLTVSGATTLTGLLDANGGATIDNVRIGILNDNTIDTSTGNLTLDSAGGTVRIDDNLTILNSNTLTVSGVSNLNGGADIKNVTIGIAGNGEITTTAGNLILNSTGGTVRVNDNLIVAENLTVTGDLTVSGNNNIVPTGSRMTFYQNSVPNGWSLLTNVNDRTIRITNTLSQGGTSGGNVSFTSTFTQRGVPLLAHSHNAQIGSNGQHSHNGSTTGNGGHTHSIRSDRGGSGDNVQGMNSNDGLGVIGKSRNVAFINNKIGSVGNHQHQLQINDNGSHNHGINIGAMGQSTASMDFRVTYINMILCQKS
jgi:hypothetical protein